MTSSSPFDRLRELFRAEHEVAVPPEASRMADEIRGRHGESVAAVLFYGSCLRKADVRGGVLDFYAVVDTYRLCYHSRLLALANAALPPNVFLVSIGEGEEEVHAKYAVISRRDFADGVTGRTLHSIVWARFCQPSRIVWARDESTRETLASACAEATVTMVRTSLALGGPLRGRPVDAETLWQAGFSATYATELRTESPETIRALYEAAPERYAKVGELAVRELALRGEIALCEAGEKEVLIDVPAAWQRHAADRWRRRTALAKAVYLVRLVKSALTFGDWLPYALWKLGRHTGARVELTPLQRRYPLIFGWPALIKLLASRKLR
jgi:hypothetical protein